MLVARIDEEGSEAFTMRAIEDMETDNPELLQMAHNFALRHRDYLGVMQGFALLYQALVAQGAEKRHDVRVRNGACEQVLHDGARFRSSQVGAAVQFF